MIADYIESSGFCCLKKLKVYNRVPVSKMSGRLVHSCRDDMIVMYCTYFSRVQRKETKTQIKVWSALYVSAFSHSEVLNLHIIVTFFNTVTRNNWWSGQK